MILKLCSPIIVLALCAGCAATVKQTDTSNHLFAGYETTASQEFLTSTSSVTGGRSRGAAGKKPVIVACESLGEHAGYVAIEAVDKVDGQGFVEFAKRHLKEHEAVFTDGLPALRSLNERQLHVPQNTPADKVDDGLPWVHILSQNMLALIGIE